MRNKKTRKKKMVPAQEFKERVGVSRFKDIIQFHAKIEKTLGWAGDWSTPWVTESWSHELRNQAHMSHCLIHISTWISSTWRHSKYGRSKVLPKAHSHLSQCLFWFLHFSDQEP